ncbi:TlpA family protein disulfide reductase [Dokdonella ginsengisoli]|uniref:TlpA family protein disulfide reductase n=1 Tax=Dokdonella ginsengisoli TaxID=363846 RepID=A0ABV9QQZ0_9GAMM
MKRSRLLRLCAAFGLAAFVAAAGTVTAQTPKQPALKVATLDGGTFDLAAERGKWVIVNFWATWCSPCIKEMPDISEFVAGRKDVAAIGLAYEDTDKAEVEAFAKAHPVKYPLALVDVYKPPADFETPRGLPTTYLIAPDGSVAKKFTGPITATDLDKAIAAAKK